MQTALMPSAGVSICSCFAAAAVDLWVIRFGFKTSNHKKGSAFVPTRFFFFWFPPQSFQPFVAKQPAGNTHLYVDVRRWSASPLRTDPCVSSHMHALLCCLWTLGCCSSFPSVLYSVVFANCSGSSIVCFLVLFCFTPLDVINVHTLGTLSEPPQLQDVFLSLHSH